jgi:hypothetical protein
MHIIAIIGAIIGGIAIWYWRFKMVRDVGNDVADAVGRVRGAYRMRNFKKKAEASVLNSVDDPALAAGIFLFALANENAEAEHLAKPEIARQLEPIVDPDKHEEYVAYAEWAARSVVDARDCIRRFKTLWREQLSLAERGHLIEIAQAITALTPNPTNTQKLAIESLNTALGA